jgi:hypothetical protein
LIQSTQNLKKQGKNLYFENEKEYLELSRYRVALEEHVFWKSRRQFTLLMKFSVLKRKTSETYDALEFEINSKKLKDFQPDPRSKGFGSLISFLSAECDNFEED